MRSGIARAQKGKRWKPKIRFPVGYISVREPILSQVGSRTLEITYSRRSQSTDYILTSIAELDP